MITAHGGALGTGRNSRLYFASADNFMCDALEVDVRRRGEYLFLSHGPSIFGSYGKLPLTYAFEVVKDKNLMINCDLKNSNLAARVEALALKSGAEDRIIYTGSINEREAMGLTYGRAFFNQLDNLPYRAGNAAAIKRRLESYNNPVFAGINVNKLLVDDSFLEECVYEGVKVSLFTVNSRREAERYSEMNLYNITTNIPDTVRSLISTVGFSGAI
ncbi:MAG: hypothetical protein K2M44_01910 [Clostridia bacterium]|nr:hypothetical protein [Clostridia bacterium]